MGITILQLMDSGMSYEEAVKFQIISMSIMCSVVLILILLKYTTKKYCPKFYKKLKQYNVF